MKNLRKYSRICGAGYKRDIRGNCVRVRKNVQRCANGYHRGSNGRCVLNARRPGDRKKVKRPDRSPPRRSPGTRPTPPRKKPAPPSRGGGRIG